MTEHYGKLTITGQGKILMLITLSMTLSMVYAEKCVIINSPPHSLMDLTVHGALVHHHFHILAINSNTKAPTVDSGEKQLFWLCK